MSALATDYDVACCDATDLDLHDEKGIGRAEWRFPANRRLNAFRAGIKVTPVRYI